MTFDLLFCFIFSFCYFHVLGFPWLLHVIKAFDFIIHGLFCLISHVSLGCGRSCTWTLWPIVSPTQGFLIYSSITLEGVSLHLPGFDSEMLGTHTHRLHLHDPEASSQKSVQSVRCCVSVGGASEAETRSSLNKHKALTLTSCKFRFLFHLSAAGVWHDFIFFSHYITQNASLTQIIILQSVQTLSQHRCLWERTTGQSLCRRWSLCRSMLLFWLQQRKWTFWLLPCFWGEFYQSWLQISGGFCGEWVAVLMVKYDQSVACFFLASPTCLCLVLLVPCIKPRSASVLTYSAVCSVSRDRVYDQTTVGIHAHLLSHTNC